MSITRDEVRELLPDATDEQVESLFKRFGQEVNPAKARAKEAEAHAADLEGQLKAEQTERAKLAASLDEANAKLQDGMSAEELMAQREQAAEAREREFLLKSNGLEAKALFVAAGCFPEDKLDTLVEQVTSEDLDATVTKAQTIIEVTQVFGESAKKDVKDELLRNNPKLEGGQGSKAPMNLKEFLALPYGEQLAMKQANPNILSELNKE